jgi:hypothetical protein
VSGGGKSARPSAIRSLGLAGAPSRAAEVDTPPGGVEPKWRPPGSPHGDGPPRDDARLAAARRDVEITARKVTSAERKLAERRAQLDDAIGRARVDGLDDDAVRGALGDAELPAGSWPQL